MSCYFCTQDGFVHGPDGSCHCGLAVCVFPNVRPDDRVFHGERCACGCDRVFCTAHVSSHQGCGTGSGCFPNFALILGEIGSRAATRELVRKETEQVPDGKAHAVMSFVLNFLRPGHEALAKAANERGMKFGVLIPRAFGKLEAKLTDFDEDFFSGPVLERVLALCAHEYAMAWRALNVAPKDVAFRSVERWRSRWSGSASRYGELSIGRDLRSGSWSRTRVEAEAWESVRRRLDEVGQVPRDAPEAAVWLASDAEQRSTVLPVARVVEIMEGMDSAERAFTTSRDPKQFHDLVKAMRQVGADLEATLKQD